MNIRPLAAAIVSRIVAGEVIDSLAAAVRELVDNSIDAGATAIHLQLWPEQGRVQISDDGCGLNAADLAIAAAPYTTSKLTDDLEAIATLGFRGEALHSLAQVASLTIQSRTTDADYGHAVTYDPEGNALALTPVAIAIGTRIEITQLFANWPSRQAQLRNSRRELKRVQAVIQAAAIAQPQIRWQARVDDKPWLALWPGTVADLLVQLIPQLELGHLRTLEQDGQSLTLALPDRYYRPRPDWQRLVINGRCVDCPPLIETLQAAFRRSLPRDRHPLWVARLKLTGVDWNRDPAKQSVYIPNLEAVQTHLQSLATAALATTSAVNFRRSQAIVRSTASYYSTTTPLAPSSLTPVAIVGYWQNMYILVANGDDLLVVEQHVADERVRFTQLQQAWRLEACEQPPLLSHLSESQHERLEQWGWQPEPFGEQLWALRAVPQILHDHPDRDAFLAQLSHCPDLEAVQVAIACQMAVRNGTAMSLAEQTTLIQAWQHCPNPHTCPHGRPIYLSLREQSLARFFRRHWRSCQSELLSSRLFTQVNSRLQ